MKTTIDIPEDVLLEAIQHTNATTKRDAVVNGLRAFNRSERLAKLVGMMGQSDSFMTHEELMSHREASETRAST